MENTLNNDLSKEILTILPYLDDKLVNGLSKDLLANLTDLAATSTKDFYIQKYKNLSEQNLSEECKNFISLLYYQYVDMPEKNEIFEKWLLNDSIH